MLGSIKVLTNDSSFDLEFKIVLYFCMPSLPTASPSRDCPKYSTPKPAKYRHTHPSTKFKGKTTLSQKKKLKPTDFILKITPNINSDKKQLYLVRMWQDSQRWWRANGEDQCQPKQVAQTCKQREWYSSRWEWSESYWMQA